MEAEVDTTFTVEAIQAVVTRHFNIKIQDLKSTSRARSVARPRHIAMYLARKYTVLGLKEIGAHFGGRDHSTVLHACLAIEKGLEAEAEIRQSVESIQDLL